VPAHTSDNVAHNELLSGVSPVSFLTADCVIVDRGRSNNRLIYDCYSMIQTTIYYEPVCFSCFDTCIWHNICKCFCPCSLELSAS